MNKFVKLIMIVVSFLIIVPAFADTQTEECQSIELIAKILDAKEVWPGYQISSTPIIITFKNGHIYAFGLNSNQSGWSTMTIAGKRVQYSPQDNWGFLKSPMQADFKIENKTAFVYQLDHMKKDNPMKAYLVFVHERFHQHQFRYFNIQKSSQGYQDSLNVENLTLMQIEERILENFLETPDVEYLKDFLAISKLRLTQITSSSAAHESEQQIMEGLADYVSLKLFDETPVVPNFSGKTELTRILSEYKTQGDIAQRAMKWRHYGIGAALGYALDYLQVPNWKENVQYNGQSQLSQIEKALYNPSENWTQRAERVKNQYGYEETKQETQTKVDKNRSYLDSLMDGYANLSGINITVGKLKRAGQNGGGNTKQLINLSNGTVLALNDDSFATSTDKAWNLRLKKVPYAFKGRQGEILFKVEHELSITVDHQTYLLSDLLKRPSRMLFQNISWTGSKSEFTCTDRPGALVIDKDQIFVEFL